MSLSPSSDRCRFCGAFLMNGSEIAESKCIDCWERDDTENFCRRCSQQFIDRELRLCEEDDCDAQLCPDCRRKGEGRCNEHQSDDAPESVPRDWWKGGIADDH